jgi:hypothetical protein
MKTKDLPIFKQKILDMLPVLQMDMWKKLDINSREGSYIVDIMLKEHLLTRRRKDSSFLLEKLNGNGNGNIDDLNNETGDDLKKKKVGADLKKKAEADLKKKKVEADLKKKAEADLKKKAEADLKKKKVEVDLKKKKVAIDLDKKAEADLDKKAEADLKKKKVAIYLDKKAEADLNKKAEADLNKKVEADPKKGTDFIAKTHDKNIQSCKAQDINVLKQKVLDVLPILQANIWKRLDACDCNYLELIDIMVKENLIVRTKQGSFFLLEAVNGDERKNNIKTDVSIVASDKHSHKKKPKDTSELKKWIFGMLPIAPSGILEKLDVSSRMCSSAINAMIEEKLIVRTEKNGNFLLEEINKDVKKHERDYTATLSSKKRFAPCCGCSLECDATVCTLLTEWLLE